MDSSKIIGLIIFFSSFFIFFTLVPRFIYRHLEKLLIVSKKTFFSNYTALLVTYLALGIPITLILYFGSTFGDSNVIKNTFEEKIIFVTFITSLIMLVSIRLSLILKKRPILKNIPLFKKLDGLIPEISSREKLTNEYKSYLFGIFFTAFMSFIMVILFKVLFLSNQTVVKFKGYEGNVTNISQNIGTLVLQNWHFILYFLAIPLIAEILIKFFQPYPELQER